MSFTRLPQQISGTAYTLQLTDDGGYLYCTNGSAVTITVPPNSSVPFSVGAYITIDQEGTGKVTVAAGGGVTINPSSTLSIANQYGVAGLFQVSANTWTWFGTVSA